MLFAYISVLISLLYVVLISSFTIGWSRLKIFNPNISANSNTVGISVIVAFKNEEQHLQLLLNALQNQTRTDFELILVL